MSVEQNGTEWDTRKRFSHLPRVDGSAFCFCSILVRKGEKTGIFRDTGRMSLVRIPAKPDFGWPPRPFLVGWTRIQIPDRCWLGFRCGVRLIGRFTTLRSPAPETNLTLLPDKTLARSSNSVLLQLESVPFRRLFLYCR